jgi:hypothetical protein
LTREDDITLVELQKNYAYLKEIGSKYSTSHYYDVSVHGESGSWRIELVYKPFEKTLDKNYHGKLFEDHIEEPRVLRQSVKTDRSVGLSWVMTGGTAECEFGSSLLKKSFASEE